MPREIIGDHTTPGRYTLVNWRRDAHEPGYVQVSTHGPDGTGGEFVHLDAAGIDRLIKTLHKAKRQAFGDPDGKTVDLTVTVPDGVSRREFASTISRLVTDERQRYARWPR